MRIFQSSIKNTGNFKSIIIEFYKFFGKEKNECKLVKKIKKKKNYELKSY